MKSYSKVLLISALLSCVAVRADEKVDEQFDATRLVKTPVKASLRYAERVVPAIVLLWLSTELVERTPLNRAAVAIGNVELLKKIEGIIPGATKHEILKKMTTVALGAFGITCADTVLKQKDIRSAMKKHCPSIVKMLDKAFDFFGMVD